MTASNSPWPKDVVGSEEMRRLAGACELRLYSRPPRAMYVGAPGKVGYLAMRFERDPDGRSVMRRLRRMAPLIVQRELYCDATLPDMPVVYILSSGGPNVDGDRYCQEIEVGPGAMAHITTGAATKVAEMRDNFAAMVQRIALDEGAYLELMPEPLIPCRSSRYATDTLITCHPAATLLYSEAYACGRKHSVPPEVFAYDLLSATVEVRRPDGRRLLREKLVVEPAAIPMTEAGMMGPYCTMANVIALTPPECADKVYEATGAGVDHDVGTATAITRLPGEAGLLLRVLSVETAEAMRIVRRFASAVRMAVKGKPLPPEFPWR